MVDLDLKNSCTAQLQTRVIFCGKGESSTVFLVLSAASGDDCLIFGACYDFL